MRKILRSIASMSQLTTPVKANCKYFTLFCKGSYVLIARCYLENIHIIEKINLSWWMAFYCIAYYKNTSIVWLNIYLDLVRHMSFIQIQIPFESPLRYLWWSGFSLRMMISNLYHYHLNFSLSSPFINSFYKLP